MQRPKQLFEEAVSDFKLSAKEKAYALYGVLWTNSASYNLKSRMIYVYLDKDQMLLIKQLMNYWGLKAYQLATDQLVIRPSPPMFRHYEKFSRLINIKGTKIISSYAADRANELGIALWLFLDGDKETRQLDWQSEKMLSKALSRHDIKPTSAEIKELPSNSKVSQYLAEAHSILLKLKLLEG